MTTIYLPHECDQPLPCADGQLWECDHCGHVWRASCPGNPNYAGWRKLGPVGRWLHGVKRTKS